MKNTREWHPYLLPISLSLLIISVVACAQPTSTSAPAGKEPDIEVPRMLFEQMCAYNWELHLAKEMAKERSEQTWEAVRAEKICMAEASRRELETTLALANIIAFLDRKPEYKALMYCMWGKEGPPKLGWHVPDTESERVTFEQYLNGWIASHDYYLDLCGQILEKWVRESK